MEVYSSVQFNVILDKYMEVYNTAQFSVILDIWKCIALHSLSWS